MLLRVKGLGFRLDLRGFCVYVREGQLAGWQVWPRQNDVMVE